MTVLTAYCYAVEPRTSWPSPLGSLRRDYGVTTPSTQHVVVKTEQRPPHPLARLWRSAKPMPPPPPIRSNRSSPY
eukprot:1882135-Amphidinium_carterae.1